MATIEQRIQWVVDRRSQSETKSALSAIRTEQAKLTREFTQGKIETEKYEKQLANLDTQAERLEAALKGLNAELDKTEKPREIDLRTDEFDRVSRDVGLAGDVQSNLGAIAGLAGASGATGLASGVGIAGELIVLTEELPRLKTALQGLPQTVSAAASALGTTSGALVGLGAALLGLGVAIAFARNQAANSTIANNNLIESLRNEIALRTEAGQLTSDEIADRREQLAAQLEVAQAQAQVAQQTRDQLFENTNIFIEGAGRLSAVLGVGNQAFKNTADEVTQANSVVIDLEKSIGVLDQALQSNEVAANDAAQSERELAEARTDAILAQSSLASELERTRQSTEDFGLAALESAQRQLAILQGQDVAGAGQQAVQSRLDSLEDERRAIEAQIRVLEQSGDASDAVTAQLEALRDQLQQVAQQTDIVEESLDAALARDRETKAIEAQIEGIREAERERERQARSQEQFQAQLQRINEQRLDAQRKLQFDLLDLERDTANERIDIGIQAERAREDALSEGRFLELAKIQREENRELQDLQRTENRKELAIREGNERQLATIRNSQAAIVLEFRNLMTNIRREVQNGSVSSSRTVSGGSLGMISAVQRIG